MAVWRGDNLFPETAVLSIVNKKGEPEGQSGLHCFVTEVTNIAQIFREEKRHRRRRPSDDRPRLDRGLPKRYF